MTILTEEQYLRLVDLAVNLHDEAERCAAADCFHAACLMIGGALEAGLQVTAFCLEDGLRSSGLWPEGRGPLLKWSLDTLVHLAKKAGWVPIQFAPVPEDVNIWEQGELGDLLEFVQYVRNLAAHPGLIVKDIPSQKLGQAAYSNAYLIVRDAFDALYNAVSAPTAMENESLPHLPL